MVACHLLPRLPFEERCGLQRTDLPAEHSSDVAEQTRLGEVLELALAVVPRVEAANDDAHVRQIDERAHAAGVEQRVGAFAADPDHLFLGIAAHASGSPWGGLSGRSVLLTTPYSSRPPDFCVGRSSSGSLGSSSASSLSDRSV